MKENAKLTNFRRILNSKCQKEHENFDKKFEKINAFTLIPEIN